jgi:hypothetical protein
LLARPFVQSGWSRERERERERGGRDAEKLSHVEGFTCDRYEREREREREREIARYMT